VRILALTNLYPPHHAGTDDVRCQAVVEQLRARGHELLVLTSTHGMQNERTDEGLARRWRLHGAFGYPQLTSPSDLQPLEAHNHAVLQETLTAFKPDLLHVFSLRGLGKSLVFGFHHARLPTVYDVADPWMGDEIKQDPWLRWWNHPGGNGLRSLRELLRQRAKLDAVAPTRSRPGCDRLPELYAEEKDGQPAAPDSIRAFAFDYLYFCSHALKEATVQAGFKVSHGEIVPPGIPTQAYLAEVRPESAPVQKLLFVGRLTKASGLLTAARALQILRARQIKVTLSVHGRGESKDIAEVRSFVSLQRLPVEFLPASNMQRDLPALFRQHDALLHPAEEAEPFFLTPLYAMAAGLPVIGTSIGGAKDLFRHEENALTFAPGEAAEMADCIQRLCTQPPLRRRLAETGQSDVLANYNENIMAERIETQLETSRQVWQAGG
jgi:glycogen synthase